MFWLYSGFILFILLLLALDLGVFNRKAHVVSVKEALGWSAMWIALGLAFSVFVYFGYEYQWLGLGTNPHALDAVPSGRIDGRSALVKYLTGYVVEKSLSVDNIFVIAMIFSFFAVPAIYQHRVLFWGILGALIMRGAMIGLGAHLIARFNWVLYVFGGLLVLTALRMLMISEGPSDPARSWVVRAARRLFRVTEGFHGEHFFVRAGSEASHEPAVEAKSYAPGKAPPNAGVQIADKAVERAKDRALMLTPLTLSLLMVETTDLIFAVDSIPAIFAITADPFIVFTSNVFAILGLRSLYFALAGAIQKFRFLKVSLAAVLGVVGVKMLIHDWLAKRLGEHFNLYLLAVVLLILLIGVLASVLMPGPPEENPKTPPATPGPGME